MDFSFVMNVFPALIRRLPLTMFIVVVTAIVGFALAVLVAALRLKRLPVLHPILNLYVSFAKSTPGLIHIFLVYYGLPVLMQGFGIDINTMSRVTFSIIALVLYNGAFVSDILIPAYLSVSRDQHDAALSVGMTQQQVNRRIIYPQVVPVALPSLGNALIDLLKDTSLLFLIGLIDVMGQAEIIIANTLGVYQLEVYLAVAILYWLLSIVLELFISSLEKRSKKYIG